MKIKYLLTLLGFLLSGAYVYGQSYAFGLKGGLTIGTQDWNGIERQPLFKYHGIAFIETAPEEDKFALLAQLGYHVKGSAIRNRRFRDPFTGQIFKPPSWEFQFRNLSLVLGGKSKFDLGGPKAYYMVGVRLDYTVSTNLGDFREYNLNNPTSGIFPFEEGVNKFNYGFSAGGGMEFPFSDFVRGVLEFTVNPDFSRQYEQPPIRNITDPFTGNPTTIPERIVRNLTFEVTAGFRFLHKIEYIDDY